MKLLSGLTALILAYSLTAAINARAIYHPRGMGFEFRDCVTWLPHSYNQGKSFQAFWSYLALAAFFWSFRDWLLGESPRSAHQIRKNPTTGMICLYLPDRLRRILWLLCLNGALLALQAILQRWIGGDKLLWLVEPRINRDALSQFGPFAYRANAAQYFNLVWPLGLALWWELRREARRMREQSVSPTQFRSALLLTTVLLTAASPIISTSRMGAAVTFVAILIAALLIATGLRQRHPGTIFGSVLFFAGALATGVYFGWDDLSKRLVNTEQDYASREAIYATARRVTHDYPVFGTGPGSFEAIFQLYRSSTEEYWPAQLHNDWLETLITFGWVGSSLIAMAFLCVLAHWFRPGAVQTNWRTAAFIWLALAGCLVHARFDFPLQVYSILHLFLLQCAILSVISHRDSLTNG